MNEKTSRPTAYWKLRSLECVRISRRMKYQKRLHQGLDHGSVVWKPGTRSNVRLHGGVRGRNEPFAEVKSLRVFREP